MKILLTNDDGIQSVGLLLLAKTLSQKHEVYVCAPDGERSAYSHYINFHRPIYFKQVEVEGATNSYAISGTPADCVMFAARHLKITPDVVISGPNRGANLATDIIYSGTVGASQEAVILGLKSIALSSCSYKDNHFDTCCQFIYNNLETLLKFEFKENLLNINVPNLCEEEIRGVIVARQGHRPYSDYYAEIEIDGKIGYSLEGTPHEIVDCPDLDSTEFTDVNAVHLGYISITPLHLDRTDYSAISQAKELLCK
ncbi:MAG: 5'/3'-nucleotidase SurE [Clostridia bacterium]